MAYAEEMWRGATPVQIGEVGLMTRDVIRLAAFYKWLLGVEDGSEDADHQVILAKETMLTVCHDDGVAPNGGNICLAFTVADVDAEYRRLLESGVRILEPPKVRPWGMKNLSFYDPDGNRVFFRSPLQ